MSTKGNCHPMIDKRDDNLVLFRKCANNTEASTLRMFLAANGIYCVVQGEQSIAPMLGTVGTFTGVDVLVAPSEVERAAAVLTEAEGAPKADSVAEEAQEQKRTSNAEPSPEGSSGEYEFEANGAQSESAPEPVRRDPQRIVEAIFILLVVIPLVAAVAAIVFHRCA